MGRRLVVAAAACGLLAGCGEREPVIPVQGRVVYQGKPVTGAVVVFQSTTGADGVFAALNGDGMFQVSTHDRKGLPPGTYRVAVKPAAGGDGPAPLAGTEKDTPAPRPNPLVPAKFHAVETSGLTVKVEPGGAVPVVLDLSR